MPMVTLARKNDRPIPSSRHSSVDLKTKRRTYDCGTAPVTDIISALVLPPMAVLAECAINPSAIWHLVLNVALYTAFWVMAFLISPKNEKRHKISWWFILTGSFLASTRRNSVSTLPFRKLTQEQMQSL